MSGWTVKAQDTTTCSITVLDTVRYVNSLSSGVQGTSINMSNGTGGTAGYTGYAQLFEAPDSITLKGFCFYGLVEGALPDTVDADLFLADGVGGAPGTLIENVRVGVPNYASYGGLMNDQEIKRCAVFSTPLEIEGDYFLSIRNVTDANIFMAINFDGDAEATPSEFTYYYDDVGSFTGWYDLGPFGVGWGFNPIIEPIVEYQFEGIAISTDSTLCLGDTLSVSMNLAAGDSAFFSKYYNPNFASYTGLFGSNIINYGDGTGNTVDTFHVYNSGGNFTVDRNFNIITPLWSQNTASFSCNVDVRVVDASVDLGVDTSVCSGTVLTFDAGTGFDTYLWNDLTVLSTLSIDTDTMANGTYDYFVNVAKEYCNGLDTIVVSVGDLMVDLGVDTTLCLNQDLTLTAGTYDSYAWNTGQTTETISVGPFTGTSTESYVLTVESGACVGMDTLVLIVDNCLGVSEFLNASINVYPNPSNGIFNIDLSQLNNTSGTISILDAAGRMVWNKNITSANEEIDLLELAKGSYFVEINAGGERIIKKIQIIK